MTHQRTTSIRPLPAPMDEDFAGIDNPAILKEIAELPNCGIAEF
jgi:hypothetical protein